MKRYLIIYIVYFIISGVAMAQEENSNYKVNWLAPQAATDYFPGRLVIADQQSSDDKTGLPVTLHKIDLPTGITSDGVMVSIKVLATEPLTDKERSIVGKLSADINMLDYFVAFENKKPILNIEVLPVQINSASGELRKVTEYSLAIEYKDGKKSVQASSTNTSSSYASNSVLSSGKWVKIKIDKDGVYRIPYSDLKSWGFNNPSNVKVFGNGGIMLPKSNNEFRFDDLRENGVMHFGDAIYFYGKGSVKWSYDADKQMWIHQIHDFGEVAFYFLTEDVGVGVGVGIVDDSDKTPNVEVDSYDAYAFHELELRNLISSGRTWYGEWFRFRDKQSEVFSFDFKNKISSIPMKISTSVLARSNVTSRFEIRADGNAVPIQTLSVRSISFSDYTGYFGHRGEESTSFNSIQDNVDIEVKYVLPTNTAQGWLNYLCLNATCELKMEGGIFGFRTIESVGEGNIARYNLSNTDGSTIVWDVSDYTRPLKVKTTLSGNTTTFIAKADSLKEYVAFNPGGSIPFPVLVGDVANQNLHSVSGIEYVVVAYRDFVSEANRLAALHQAEDGYTTFVVTPEQIYNEFSSGQPDISAIRDFMRMLYKKADSKTLAPKYLLLFGDGSYNNRSYEEKNTNRILTYQSVVSNHHASSYITDDFYGFLDDNEGGNIQRDLLDIGVGRFPVNTVQEAADAVNKVEAYMKKQYPGKWKAQLTFVGDDGDNNIHMRDADRLTQKLAVTHPEFDLNKIYLDSYQKVTTSTGKVYPEVNNLVEKAITEGSLLFNYTGHGSENGLAHEKIMTIPDIQGWTNIDRLPMFVTATCEFSRFDNPAHTSAGEWVFLNSLGGGIGLFTTTRLVYSSLNYIINNNLIRFLFEKDNTGEKLRLGDIMRLTKNASGTSINILNFTLLADPGIQIAYPSKYIETVSVNEKPIAEAMDTLKALSKAKIEGEIVRSHSSIIDNFDGVLNITVFDKPTRVITLGNDGAKPFEYDVFQNRLFTGQVPVENGEFASEFIVSKDIRYNIGTARVSYYSSDDTTGVEAFGANNKIIVGGISDSPPIDNEGPQIKLYLNKETFVSGGVTGVRPLLYAELFDENGINTAGNGIGHDVTLVIDDKSNTIVMNSYFKSVRDSYQEGMVVFQLLEQKPGLHKLSFKAWDNLNNSSTVEIEFNVQDGGELNVEKVSVFPNPVSNSSFANLYFTHDEPNVPLTLEISTFNISGQLLNKVVEKTVSAGSSIQPVQWYPKASNGLLLSSGLYIVRFKVMSQTGKTTVFSQKILVTE